MKNKEVDEPPYEKPNHCERCDEIYCSNCVDFIEVDFDITEGINADHPNPNAKRYDQNWKGEKVCPWCYNQLVRIKERKEEDD